MRFESARLSGFAIFAVALVILTNAACGSDDTSEIDAAQQSSDRSGATASPTSPPPSPTPAMAATDTAEPVDVVDLSHVPLADAEAARSVLALAADGGDRAMVPGTWFSSAYSSPLAFDMPGAGRLRDQGPGWTVIEVGDAGSEEHGIIRIIEAVALSSPQGPIPIALVDADSEFADTRVLAVGRASSAKGDMSWRDFVIESERVPEQFRKPCGGPGSGTCVDGFIAEGGPVLLETDRLTRTVAQPFDDGRLYVVATALGSDADRLMAQALHIAASVVTTDRTDEPTRRPLSMIGNRADSIAAGDWFVDWGDVVVQFSLDRDVAGVSLLDTGPTWFAFEALAEDDEPMIFSAQLFQGFVDGVLGEAVADPDLPLTTDVFLGGVDAVVPVEARGEGSIGGRVSEWHEVGSPRPDTPWTCTPQERRDLDPDESCAVYTIDGWRFVDSDDRSIDYRHHYVEEFGVVVAYPGSHGADDFVVSPPFDLLLESMTISPD